MLMVRVVERSSRGCGNTRGLARRRRVGDGGGRGILWGRDSRGCVREEEAGSGARVCALEVNEAGVVEEADVVDGAVVAGDAEGGDGGGVGAAGRSKEPAAGRLPAEDFLGRVSVEVRMEVGKASELPDSRRLRAERRLLRAAQHSV